MLRRQAQRRGYVRDTVVYSVVAAEWPAVEKGLQFRVERAMRRAAD